MEGKGAEYSASYFMDEDVVLVTLNYRVGALGTETDYIDLS